MTKSLNYNRTPFNHGYQRPTAKPHGPQWSPEYKHHVKALANNMSREDVSDEVPTAGDSWSFDNLPAAIKGLIERSEDPQACWLWHGETYDNSEYPKWWDAKAFRDVGMRRYIYERFTGIRRPKMARLHMDCDDRGCLNPEHMRVAGG